VYAGRHLDAAQERGGAMSTQAPLTERGPQALAEQVDALAQLAEGDHEAYKVLATAREQLRALSWARFRARHEHSDKLFMLRRRHKGRRIAQEGRSHA
jgi:ABC-type hemin transport system substrate-binding protein